MGDGTTSVVVLAGELLREAELLVNQKVHPMVIIAGAWGGYGGASSAVEGSGCRAAAVVGGQRQVPLVRRSAVLCSAWPGWY